MLGMRMTVFLLEEGARFVLEALPLALRAPEGPKEAPTLGGAGGGEACFLPVKLAAEREGRSPAPLKPLPLTPRPPAPPARDPL